MSAFTDHCLSMGGLELAWELAAQRGLPEGGLTEFWTFDWKFKTWDRRIQGAALCVSLKFTDFRWHAALNGKLLEGFGKSGQYPNSYENARDAMRACEAVSNTLGFDPEKP